MEKIVVSYGPLGLPSEKKFVGGIMFYTSQQVRYINNLVEVRELISGGTLPSQVLTLCTSVNGFMDAPSTESHNYRISSQEGLLAFLEGKNPKDCALMGFVREARY